MQIPTDLIARVERVHGEPGKQWLARLPALVSECCARWSLKLDPPLENLSYNLVLPGRIAGIGLEHAPAGTAVALKLGVPCSELVTEAAALSLFQGTAAVLLIDHDASLGALLMERILPGTAIHKVQGEVEATRSAAALMRRLWRTPPGDHIFPTLSTWFGAFKRLRNRFDGGTGPFPQELIAKAERTFAELNASAERSIVLHGDLHHENILFSEERGWLAIDPKGICGDPGYDVGPFMLNQVSAGTSTAATIEILTNRLSVFSEELGISRERLARWAFCHAVLSALWDFEESAEWSGTIRLAQLLERLVA